MRLENILFGVAAIIAAWKFGKAAVALADSQVIRAHGRAEVDEAVATSIFNESLPVIDDDDDDWTVH